MTLRIESLALAVVFGAAFYCSGVPMYGTDEVTAQESNNQQASESNGAPELVTTIEGISEYRLPSGTQVLLFPDASKSMVTVNMTIFVGSRHEGYGEAGMAHLLEHMLFKGTPSHQKIPELLADRGASFNGTTWLDRTNYYETLPATTAEQSAENLEFAVRLEADRLMNSNVLGEDLASEMTVVRNEFESGENSPFRVLTQRIQSVAFDWHNYGRSTIGNQSDIERVPVDRLRAFYRKFYRPDNCMVVIAGKFERDKALQLVEKYFGILEAPEVPLDRTYTTEPPQDGERTVVLRRVGNTQLVASMYHVPSAANREYAAVEMLAYIYGTEPSGRLYRDLVKTEIASGVTARSMPLFDPGSVSFGAQVPVSKSIESARQALINSVEGIANEAITEEELKRAKLQFKKDRELRSSDTREIAIELSEWAAQGDWRLYFLFRDYIESLTPEDCTRAGQEYLTRNNRTIGLFIPSEQSERVQIPAKPNLDELLAGYQGRGDIEEGEEFDPSPLAVEERTLRDELNCGLKTAFLPKKTRGGSVNFRISLRYGNEESLLPYRGAMEFLPAMLLRGTTDLDYQQLQDRLDELRAQVGISGTSGLLTVAVETKREYLEELIPLIAQIVRQPRFDEGELDILKRQTITRNEANMTEPRVLAGIAVRRELAPYDPSDMRYVPTIEERIQTYREVRVEQLRELHGEQIGASHGEVTAVGDFDPDALAEWLDREFADWASEVPQARIATAASNVAGKTFLIETPDKANAVYYGGDQIAMRDDHPDYPALLVGNYILGGGSMASRLGKRVRQQEGLSYGVGTGVSAHPIDERTNLTIMAITNPLNKDKLVAVIQEELLLLLKDGVTEAELEAAKQGLLQRSQLGRVNDGNLTEILTTTIFAERDMSYYANIEDRMAALSVDDVNQVIRKYISPKNLVVAIAGDFENAQQGDATE